MICPRCRHPKTTVLATSPVPGVWEVLSCDRCLFSWRTTEPANRIDPDRYPARYRFTEHDIESAVDVPVVPA
ncbi:hypothetical protein D5S17_10020 [Pseudonocardiaceae bacterium YIM PH 21723]|nr:hypothetical protein D5S17_10020 [Pseudonocardiaceae bacterium YIM PH 21723]